MQLDQPLHCLFDPETLDIHTGVVQANSARGFFGDHRNGFGDHLRTLKGPGRMEIVGWRRVRRPLDVGRGDSTGEHRDAVFAAVWDEFLEEVVAGPLGRGTGYR